MTLVWESLEEDSVLDDESMSSKNRLEETTSRDDSFFFFLSLWQELIGFLARGKRYFGNEWVDRLGRFIGER